jgi:hypothetical protein
MISSRKPLASQDESDRVRQKKLPPAPESAPVEPLKVAEVNATAAPGTLPSRKENILTRMMSRRQPLTSSVKEAPKVPVLEKDKVEAPLPITKHHDKVPLRRSRRRRSNAASLGMGGGLPVWGLLQYPSLKNRNQTNYTPMDVKKSSRKCTCFQVEVRKIPILWSL